MRRRPVRPPRQAEAKIDGRWRRGTLDLWIRPPGQDWLGRFTRAGETEPAWYPALSLRLTGQ